MHLSSHYFLFELTLLWIERRKRLRFCIFFERDASDVNCFAEMLTVSAFSRPRVFTCRYILLNLDGAGAEIKVIRFLLFIGCHLTCKRNRGERKVIHTDVCVRQVHNFDQSACYLHSFISSSRPMREFGTLRRGKKLSDLRHAVRDRCNLQVERFHPFVTFSQDKRVGRTEIYDIPTKGQY